MRDENTIMREALSAIRLELEARNMSMKVCASKGGISYSTFLSWFPAGGTPQVPSLAMLPCLARALPADLVSLLVPDGWHIVQTPDVIDHDDLAAGCIELASAHARARHPNSPAGVDIAPCEREELNSCAVKLQVAK